jgi:hypothetical protein
MPLTVAFLLEIVPVWCVSNREHLELSTAAVGIGFVTWCWSCNK